MRRTVIGVIGVLASTVIVVTTAGGASAAPEKERASAKTPGAKGTVTWTWGGPTDVNSGVFVVEDTECDGNDVYAQFRINYQNGEYIDLRRHYNSNGCGTQTRETVKNYRDTKAYIASVQIHVCTDDSLGNTCKNSTKVDNPYVN